MFKQQKRTSRFVFDLDGYNTSDSVSRVPKLLYVHNSDLLYVHNSDITQSTHDSTFCSSTHLPQLQTATRKLPRYRIPKVISESLLVLMIARFKRSRRGRR